MRQKNIFIFILILLFIFGCKRAPEVEESENVTPIKVGVLDHGYYSDKGFVDRVVSSLNNIRSTVLKAI